MTRNDLNIYLKADSEAQPISEGRIQKILFNRAWKLKKYLRYTEYFFNNRQRSPFHFVIYAFFRILYDHYLFKCGSEIPLNTIGKGLILWHVEGIIINPDAQIGDNCSLSARVVVAHAHNLSPTIGNNVELMINATVLGGIAIPDNCRIGANSTVLKTIKEPDTTWAGSPARKISDVGSSESKYM